MDDRVEWPEFRRLVRLYVALRLQKYHAPRWLVSKIVGPHRIVVRFG